MPNSNIEELYSNIRDNTISLPDAENEFRFWQVESLVNQAADLLDRCLSDLAIAKSFEVRAFNLTQELNHEGNLLDLEQKRIDQYVYDDQENYIKYKISFNEQNKWFHHRARSNTQANRESPSQIELLDLAQEEHGQEHSLLGTYLKWAERDKIFNKDEFEIKRSRLALKKKFVEEGQMLDFRSQAKIARDRCWRDFKDAYHRLLVAQKGLQKLFGYPGQPFLPKNPVAFGEKDQPIHDTVTWVRNTIQWISKFVHHDQFFSVTVSLLEMLGEDEFEASRDNNSFKFKIPDSYFRNHKFIRLRGISAFVNAIQVATKPWGISLETPEESKVKGSDGGYRDINQRALASLTFGRVEGRDSLRMPEVLGSTSHINSSPLSADSDEGYWKLTLEHTGLTNAERYPVNDIQLELFLVGHV